MGHDGGSPEVTVIPRLDLAGAGPGEELIAHLAPELAGLGTASSTVPSTVNRRPATGEQEQALLDLLDAQIASRWLDVAARRMRAVGQGFYTIGSAGHEADAAVALATRPGDPALLHYRSGGFYLARARQAGHPDGVLDVALGLAGSADEPIAGGRHKVFGHPDLAVIPQTSTIASHLPRALGVAWAIGRQQQLPARLRRPLRWKDDALVVASFGDASANHSTAVGMINATCWAARQGTPLPLLLVCEDNGLGISVRTPEGWIQAMFEGRPGLEYRFADGYHPLEALQVAREAADLARERQVPVLLHLATVRIGGHAGSDLESAYRSPVEISADLRRDPLGATMRLVVASGLATPAEIRGRWVAGRGDVTAAVLDAIGRPRLTCAELVMAPLSPRHPGPVADRASTAAGDDDRRRVFGDTLPEAEPPLTLAQSINRGLLDAGAAAPHLVVLGEDVARRGGVYGVTRGLQRRLGGSRVLDTLLDEQTVLGMALGAGLAGLLPVPEIQYLAYLHNAEDQLRGEAASLQFFSQGAYRNPLLVRVAGLAYQKGFGGHFHNDNSVAVLRDIPGLVVACPAHPSDAPALLRTCLAAAEVDGTVCVMVEPIALYHERDLHESGDNGWRAPYPAPATWPMRHIPIGRAATWGTGRDLTVATFGNGLRMSLRAARLLEAEGITTRVVDLRWLQPLPIEDVLREGLVTGRLLVVDETRRTGGVSEGLVTGLLEAGFTGKLARVTAEDCFVPLGDAADLVLAVEEDILDAARALTTPHP
jgi:2-oxoisovalerate dehydrogenase E1 component